jgi:hypothetical protein
MSEGSVIGPSACQRRGESSEGDPLGGLELIETPEEDLLAHSAEWRDRYQQVTMGASQ